MRNSLARCIAAALVVLAIAGCTRLPGASGDGSGTPAAPTPVAVASQSPTPAGTSADSDCGGAYEVHEPIQPTMANLQRIGVEVVVAKVLEEGSAFWDSPTGMAPTSSDRPGPGRQFSILTPFAAEVSQAVRGDRSLGPITVAVKGGRIGCYHYDVEPPIQLAVGSRYVLFLGTEGPGDASGKVSAPILYLALSVDADGKVETPLDGLMTIDAFAKAITAPEVSAKP